MLDRTATVLATMNIKPITMLVIALAALAAPALARADTGSVQTCYLPKVGVWPNCYVPSPTPTKTPTARPTMTQTPTPTMTPTAAATNTATPEATETPIPATLTATPPPSATNTPSASPTPETVKPTAMPTETEIPAISIETPTARPIPTIKVPAPGPGVVTGLLDDPLLSAPRLFRVFAPLTGSARATAISFCTSEMEVC